MESQENDCYSLARYIFIEEKCLGRRPISDETGVQGRFNQNMGQAMGGMFLSEGLDIKFGDFKTSVLHEAYSRVPDSLVRNIAGSPLAVGEIKVPWVPLHKIRDILSNRERFASDTRLANHH
ncbi:hypothetical protein ASPFODRAFT_322359 [Aspergillus luchuensis CBS 106.47]|uniref:Uncharacterized protein n=1 Tax=Aspergillus luchuensis (strain CBS 106.47) TaxID=1137211 RepID=A0A1M3T9T0_ASPLC|nr:hypothetical protein ASPFODRAFT_322359 [Aspergillus luchuensis CBS 106.47]